MSDRGHNNKKDLLKINTDIYHLCIGLLPVLYIYWVPGLNISLGTVILLGFVPHSLLYIIMRLNYRSRVSTIVFMVFYVYLILRSDGNVTRIILCLAAYINLCGMTKGSINSKQLRKIIETFAVINVILLLPQLFCYYILHSKLQYIPKSFVYIEYQNSYVFRNDPGLYRPSALFLEPSHFAQYCIFALISALFPVDENANIKKALAIGTGCILTTSGMGIALTICVFGWFIFLRREKMGKKLIIIAKWVPVVLLALVILSQTSFFQKAVQRIFSNVDGYNAVYGRTLYWDDAIGRMRGTDLWFGYGDSHTYDGYLTGLADTIYKNGIICVILEASCFLYLMIVKRDSFVWCCCIVFFVLFYVAHITNFVAQVFYFGIIISDACIPKVKRRRVNMEIRYKGTQLST